MVSSSEGGGHGLAKEFLVLGGLAAVQVVLAGYLVVLNRILALGIDPLFLVIVGGLVSSVFLLPLAVALERKVWPTRLSPGLMTKTGLIALGMTAFQALMLLGIKMTSPAIASAMPNLAPGFIFIIAACFRLEKFESCCKYSRAKILGTFVCLGGAMAMSFSQSPQSTPAVTTTTSLGETINMDWIMGCFCLFTGVLILSCTMVLQAATMVEFPAPFSLCVITSLMGSILTALLQIVTKGKIDMGSPMISIKSIVVIVLVGGAVTSLCSAFQTWCVNQKGPVLVSIFSPIQTVCSAAFSAIVLKESIGLGSLAGMLLMFAGLYIVLWAKKKETWSLLDANESFTTQTHDLEKPLVF